MLTAEQIISLYNMKPLPYEGGFYVETYRAEEKIPASVLPPRYGGDRSCCTAILYLLTKDTCSLLHKVKSDEIFHFYLGDSVTMLNIFEDGSSKIITLGQNTDKGEQVQAIVPKNCSQGCFLKEGGRFTLMGCTVWPGF